MAAYSDADVVELIARQKCYDVLTRYCRALDRADAELMRSVYWEDGIDEHGVFKGNAIEFSDYIIAEIQNWFAVTMHSISNVHMEFYGDIMCTESYPSCILLRWPLHRSSGKARWTMAHCLAQGSDGLE